MRWPCHSAPPCWNSETASAARSPSAWAIRSASRASSIADAAAELLRARRLIQGLDQGARIIERSSQPHRFDGIEQMLGREIMLGQLGQQFF